MPWALTLSKVHKFQNQLNVRMANLLTEQLVQAIKITEFWQFIPEFKYSECQQNCEEFRANHTCCIQSMNFKNLFDVNYAYKLKIATYVQKEWHRNFIVGSSYLCW